MSSLFLTDEEKWNFIISKMNTSIIWKKYDAKVADNKKGKRPYVGVVLEIEGIKYYTPFTSPKEKHRKMKNTKDFRKINHGICGAINFNNMIPVVDSALLLIDIDAMEDSKYQRLLQNQYKSIKADREQIQLTAKRLRKMKNWMAMTRE